MPGARRREVVHEHGRAFLAEAPRDRGADAAARAGDQRHPSLESSHRAPEPCRTPAVIAPVKGLLLDASDAARVRAPNAQTRRFALLPALLALCSAGAARAAATPAQRCETAAANAVRACVTKVTAEVRKCYLDAGVACSTGNTKVTRALAKLDKNVLSKCPDGGGVQAAGYGALLTPAALVGAPGRDLHRGAGNAGGAHVRRSPGGAPR